MTVPAQIVVAAAVIERDDTFLVTRRLRGTHLEGHWEFPGGKCEPGETLTACLEREIREELGTIVRVGAELHRVSHRYPDRELELHFFACTIDGTPRPLLGQEMRWVHRAALATLQFPPADGGLVKRLMIL